MSNVVVTLSSLALLYLTASSRHADTPVAMPAHFIVAHTPYLHPHPAQVHLHGSFVLCSAPDLVWCRPRPAH
ncbi:hypothetical protein [Herbaspirillum sp. alder98]|uniref:hypothetical protein n=1 Tax=Herbaspirillum sp. alder98 TaxID=2913096 RepID=UPI001CD89FB0|nr:hypothetical protein [Herbaspirillum sp. alder98]MCA1323941.1 hypothetical protein [Herbaspirillum sp. alder98]